MTSVAVFDQQVLLSQKTTSGGPQQDASGPQIADRYLRATTYNRTKTISTLE